MANQIQAQMITDGLGRLIPQYLNEETGEFEAITGSNGYPDFQLTGSNAIFTENTSVTSQQTFPFGFTSNQVQITNDGTDIIYANLQGNAPLANGGSETDVNTSSNWTFAGGTWNVYSNATYKPKYSTNYMQGTVAGETATFIPTLSNLNVLTLYYLAGANAGEPNILFSNNGGSTWTQPSAITGCSRSDGATGTAMNTIDMYAPTASTAEANITYTLPAGTWCMQVQVTTSHDPSAANYEVWIDTVSATSSTINLNAGTLTVKPGETQSLSFRSTEAIIMPNSGSQPIRLVVTN